MNREFWKKRTFTSKIPNDYRCPKCEIGYLKLEKLVSHLRPGQEELIRYNYPYGIEYIFNGILICKSNNCMNVVSISGISLKDIHFPVRDEVSGEYHDGYITEYEPKFFLPNLNLINLPKSLPKTVEEEIKLSFSHYFNDLSSCANRIRNSIEYILDDLKAPKKFKNNKNKFQVFTKLHNRILHYKKYKNKKIANLLLAIKIIGNEGSHIGNVTIEDILDAYEFLEKIINFAYSNDEKILHNKAIEIVNKNKPLSK